jgi:hypothetical protein
MNTPDTNAPVNRTELHSGSFFFTSIAGRGFYEAPCECGEFVHVIREPDNPHDRNAFMVVNSAGSLVGYLPHDIASEFAEVVDCNEVALVGRILWPEEVGFDWAIAQIRPCLIVWILEDAISRPFSRSIEGVSSEGAGDSMQDQPYAGDQQYTEDMPF